MEGGKSDERRNGGDTATRVRVNWEREVFRRQRRWRQSDEVAALQIRTEKELLVMETESDEEGDSQ